MTDARKQSYDGDPGDGPGSAEGSERAERSPGVRPGRRRRPAPTLLDMHIDLELRTGCGVALRGSVTWPAHPEPVRFDGVLELMALLETASCSAEGER